MCSSSCKRLVLVLSVFLWFGETGCFGPILTDGWYPQDPAALTTLISDYLVRARTRFAVPVGPGSIRAVIVPHAGYAYSGLCAATVFGTLLGQDLAKNRSIKRVIILAPSHSVPFNAVALPDFEQYQTVLGDIQIDSAAIKKLQKTGLFKPFREVFTHEHSVEIELPFLQSTIQDFTLVPLIVGAVSAKDIEQIARALRGIITDATLVVVSSDFVHHGQSYQYEKFADHIIDQVRQLDAQAVMAIEQPSQRGFEQMIGRTGATICGHDPICILLRLIEIGGLGSLEPRMACYYASPQVAAILQPVPDQLASTSVSYVGLLFTTEKRAKKPLVDRFTGYEKQVLLALARRSIENQFAEPGKKLPDDLLYPIASGGMSVPAGAFVTLKTKNGDLRGCIGRIETADPLYKTVCRVAQDAALRDGRFNPVTRSELAHLEVSISVLEPPVAIKSLKEISIGKHGVILTQGSHSAVFLPQVAPEQGWDLPTMLKHLSIKAGLQETAWQDPKTEFKVFEGCEFSE